MLLMLQRVNFNELQWILFFQAAMWTLRLLSQIGAPFVSSSDSSNCSPINVWVVFGIVFSG